ncbi:MAG TPA: AraC family transcriptional regulator [Verrucomicrobiae bacterium]|nr:AraC family transcriptional regulator [Verrucomicrobiae bacterium]
MNGNAHPMKRNGNGFSPAVNLGSVVGPVTRAATGPGNGRTFPENGGSEDARRIEQSIAHMREHLNQPLPVAKLAALVHVSPSYFFALFKRRTGSSPMDYFTHLRMQHACRLLDATSASVKEVAAVLGYDDPFYFSRVFKAVNRIPPSRYRALQDSHRPSSAPIKSGLRKADAAPTKTARRPFPGREITKNKIVESSIPIRRELIYDEPEITNVIPNLKPECAAGRKIGVYAD